MKNKPFMGLFSLVATLSSLGFGAYLSSLVFPLIVSTLVAFSAHGIAVFAAVAACLALTVSILAVVILAVSLIKLGIEPVESLVVSRDAHVPISAQLAQLLEQGRRAAYSSQRPASESFDEIPR